MSQDKPVPPKYRWSDDGKTVSFVNYENCPDYAPVEVQEPIAWCNIASPNGIRRFMTQKQYDANPNLQKYYEPFTCARCEERKHVAANYISLTFEFEEQKAKIAEQAAEIERLNADFLKYKRATDLAYQGSTLETQDKLAKADGVILQAGIALQEVQDLIHESHGIYGMHLNGDESPWNEIERGGRFERLCTLPDALADIEQYQRERGLYDELQAKITEQAAFIKQIADTCAEAERINKP